MSDVELSPEEQQTWDLLELLNDDMHPNAVALRLRLALNTTACHESMALPWDHVMMTKAYAACGGYRV